MIDHNIAFKNIERGEDKGRIEILEYEIKDYRRVIEKHLPELRSKTTRGPIYIDFIKVLEKHRSSQKEG